MSFSSSLSRVAISAFSILIRALSGFVWLSRFPESAPELKKAAVLAPRPLLESLDKSFQRGACAQDRRCY